MTTNSKLGIMLSGTRRQAESEEQSKENHLRNHLQGYTVHASKEEPQYLIRSDKTDHLAMHKGPALTKVGRSKRPSKRHSE
jgi:Hypervirulence associated proteins TUDOR domain